MTRNGDGWEDRLSEYLDGELGPEERGALEAHLDGCARCRATLAELTAVRERATTLAERAPARDLWPGIAARLAVASSTEGTPARGGARPAGIWRRRFALSLPQLAAAAVIVALLGGGATLLLSRAGSGPGVPVRATAPTTTEAPGAATFASDRSTSDQDVDRAVADLEAVLKQERSRLNPGTAQVVDRNLATIDSALAQIRQALRQQPTDGYLNRSLTSTMLRKLDVLRVAVRLAAPTT